MDEECQHPQDINHFKNTQPVAIMHSGSLLFFSFPLADQSYAGARAGAREIYIVKSLIYSHRGKATRKRSYFSPAKHLPAVMEERGPSHLTSGVENFFLLLLSLLFRECQAVSRQSPDNHLAQAYVCVMDLSRHTRWRVVGNKVIN